MKKMKDNKGFTLVEMLACVLTLLLICLICSTGMGISLKSYNNSLFESESQMLESTIDVLLGDVLRYAEDVKIKQPPEVEQPTVLFTNKFYQIYDKTFVIPTLGEANGGRILIQKPVMFGSPDSDPPVVLVGETVYAKTLYVKDFQLAYNEATHVFTGSYIIKSTIVETERTCSFSYRTIAAN